MAFVPCVMVCSLPSSVSLALEPFPEVWWPLDPFMCEDEALENWEAV